MAGEWCECGGDVLIVLGGSAMEHHVVGASTYWRSVYALRAHRSAQFGWILLSGAEAAPAMREFLLFQGVPEGIIRVENRSTSTRENALAAKAMLGYHPGRVVLLTSDYHMFRARSTFRKAGVEVRTQPVPDAIKRGTYWWYRWWVFTDEAVESAKIGYYFFRGWI